MRGFVRQAAGYSGNRYHQDITYYYIDGVKTNIVDKRQEWTDNGSIVPGKQHGRFGTDFSTEINRNALVPGDILWSGGHVVIVQDVIFTGDTRVVARASRDVYTIQSTSWTAPGYPVFQDWWVRKDKTWDDLDDSNNPIYSPRRLNLY